MTSGLDLKRAREDAGLTQEAVAERLGVSRVTIVNWEQRAAIKEFKADRFLRVIRELASERTA